MWYFSSTVAEMLQRSKFLLICFIFMLYEVLFLLYISNLYYMLNYMFIMYLYVYYVFLNFVIYFCFHIIWFWICAITFLFSLYAQFLLRKKYSCYNGSNFFMLYEKLYYMVFTRHSAGKVWPSICIQDGTFVFKLDGRFWNYSYRLKSFDYFRKKLHLRQLGGT